MSETIKSWELPSVEQIEAEVLTADPTDCFIDPEEYVEERTHIIAIERDLALED